MAACQILVASCLGIAAFSKFGDGGMRPFTLRQFGTPTALIRPLRWAIPGMELTAAILASWPGSARLGGIAATVLLSIFTAAVVVILLRGRRPQCACFGPGTARPIGWRAVLRNAALIAVALALAWAPPPSYSLAEQALVAAVVVISVQSWFLHAGRDRYGVDEIQAPAFELQATDGTTIRLHDILRDGRDVVLVFADPDCAPCHRLLPAVARWQGQLESRAATLIISRGDIGQNVRLAAAAGLPRVLVQGDQGLSHAYGVTATPSLVHIRGDGALTGVPVLGVEEIAEYMKSLIGAEEKPETKRRHGVLGVDPRTGAPVLAADPEGGWTVVITTARQCPECGVVMEAASHRPAHRLVFLTDQTLPGDPPAGVMAIDRDDRTARELGLPGAPAAVVLDASGVPVSAPAIGGAAVLVTLTSLEHLTV